MESQPAGEILDRFAQGRVVDLIEVAQEIDCAWFRQGPNIDRGFDRFICRPSDPLEEIGDRHTKPARNVHQAAGSDAVRALLVFLNLLKCDTYAGGQLLLAEPQLFSPQANPGADKYIVVRG